MKRNLSFSLVTFLPLYIFISLCISCVDSKSITYFNNIADTTLSTQVTGIEPVIQKGDLLSISVNSLSSETTAIFNSGNIPNSSGGVSSNAIPQAVGYLVSQGGTIDFPMLGNIEVAGLTKEALKVYIAKSLEDKKLLFDPNVIVRYLNFHVTVLGEVNKPGVVVIPNEQVTILEAIGMAGDLTIYGKRTNVLLLRKEGSQKIVRRLNLSSERVLTSPYYYLKSNDVVYIEPDKSRIASASQGRQLLPIILSGLSFLTIIADRLIIR